MLFGRRRHLCPAPDKTDALRVVSVVVRIVLRCQIHGKQNAGIEKLRTPVRRFLQRIVLGQRPYGAVVVAEQNLNLVGVRNDTGVLGGKIPRILFPTGNGGLVLAEHIQVAPRLPVSPAKLFVCVDSLYVCGNRSGNEQSPAKKTDHRTDRQTEKDTEDPSHDTKAS